MSQDTFNLLLVCIALAAYWLHFHEREAAQAQLNYRARSRMAALASLSLPFRLLYWLLAPVLVPATISYNFLRGCKPQE